jgi:hypothetical protein
MLNNLKELKKQKSLTKKYQTNELEKQNKERITKPG